MTLSDCTKADLKWLIRRILQLTAFDQQEHYLGLALNDLSYEKKKKQLALAEQHGKQADALRQRCIELLAPYDGIPWENIPLEVLEEAASAMDRANEYERKFLLEMD